LVFNFLLFLEYSSL